MEDNLKQNKTLRVEVESMDTNVDSPIGRRSRTSSIASSIDEGSATINVRGAIKRRLLEAEKPDEPKEETSSNNTTLEEIKVERQALENYLFNDNNKVNKNAIKFILAKWLLLESKLQKEIVEKEKLMLIHNECHNKKELTYAQAASGASPAGVAPFLKPKAGTSKPVKGKEKYEIVIIKPEKSEDKRSNDEIKTKVIDMLGKKREKLKVRNIRHLRNKGIVMEVNSTTDVEIIKKINLQEAGLVTSAPKKFDPNIIIYDVEKEYKMEDLKDDFIKKNLNYSPLEDIEVLKQKINFKYSFKSKNENRVNWVVQLPGKHCTSLLDAGRVFVLWRVYRIKEYVNIIRCYKCHGYGHMAKDCKVSKQICEFCGSTEHLREDCPLKEKPHCINCARSKRKDTKHHVRLKQCPEYMRQVEMYKNKIVWN